MTREEEKRYLIRGGIIGAIVSAILGIIFLVGFLLAREVYGQDFRFADPKSDPWLGDDKLIHGLGSYVVCDIVARKYSLKTAVIFTVAGGFLYEIKDGFLRSPKFGRFAGDGFSYRDLIWDILGVGAKMAIVKLTTRERKMKRDRTNGSNAPHDGPKLFSLIDQAIECGMVKRWKYLVTFETPGGQRAIVGKSLKSVLSEMRTLPYRENTVLVHRRKSE